MNKTYRCWACGFLAALLVLLAVCAGIVYTVDPCLYYRIPDQWAPVFFSERYQAAGMVKNLPADTVIMGTSMTANYRASWAAELFGGEAVRITIPDGYLSEFDAAIETLFRNQTPERVVFGLDLNILVRDDSGVTGAMPDYLYNWNPLDDLKYLLNKDTLYYSVYVLLQNRWGGGQTVDDGFLWQDTKWARYEALRTYRRPDLVEETLPRDAYYDAVAENLAVMGTWFQEHPETEFDVFFPPYSILFWDRTIRRGELDARFAALEWACETLTAYENVRLFGFLFDEETVLNLDNYCDYIHHSGETCRRMLAKVAEDEEDLTAEDWPETVENWREFVVNYNYESLWDEAFWEQWNATHDAPPVWWEGDPG